MRLLITGATGNSGLTLTQMALARGHDVTVYVRDEARFRAKADGSGVQHVTVCTGNLTDSPTLAAAMAGQDAVINAAGNATVDANYTELVESVLSTASKALGPGGRLWFFGGAAALDVPGTAIRVADLALVPAMFRQHLVTLAAAERTMLDWSMACPGPMVHAASGRPVEGLRLSKDIWPVEAPKLGGFLQTARILMAFKRQLPQMIVSYEDMAATILDHLAPGGQFARARLGLALPSGMTGSKPMPFSSRV